MTHRERIADAIDRIEKAIPDLPSNAPMGMATLRGAINACERMLGQREKAMRLAIKASERGEAPKDVTARAAEFELFLYGDK